MTVRVAIEAQLVSRARFVSGTEHPVRPTTGECVSCYKQLFDISFFFNQMTSDPVFFHGSILLSQLAFIAIKSMFSLWLFAANSAHNSFRRCIATFSQRCCSFAFLASASVANTTLSPSPGNCRRHLILIPRSVSVVPMPCWTVAFTSTRSVFSLLKREVLIVIAHLSSSTRILCDWFEPSCLDDLALPIICPPGVSVVNAAAYVALLGFFCCRIFFIPSISRRSA